MPPGPRPTTGLPPHTDTADGRERRVGIEIELAGLDPEDAARLVQDCFGGSRSQGDLYRWTIEATEFGDFAAELDTKYVHKDGTLVQSKVEEASEDLGRDLRKAIGALAEGVVPTEIVSPPIPLSRLAEIDRLTARLRAQGVADSKDNPAYAFGLHFNPEVVGTGVDDILPTLKAYLLLSPWLRAEIGIDITRQILPHIDPFPDRYVARVLAHSYAPDRDALIDDYLADNATRNRELDMLPCFAEIDAARVRKAIDDPRIKPRPTFHYRLPEARINDPDWSIMTEWSRWVLIETLAGDGPALNALAELYRENGGSDWTGTVAGFIRDWRA